MQLVWHIYLNSTGYSISAQEYILSMLSLKPDLDIKVVRKNEPVNRGISVNRNQFFTALCNKKDAKDQINIFHTIPPKYNMPKTSKKNIGISIYETIDPPKEWVHTMNKMDEIITASTFNKMTFENSGVKVPIHVVPHCFDKKMFNTSIKSLGRYNLTTFMGMGTWKTRKNWEQLIKAWYDAFEMKDNVCLVIKTDEPDKLTKTVVSIKSNSPFRTKDTAPIYAENSPQCNFEDIPSIMKKSDVYVSTSLGEGFGLCALHAMALGIPIVTTKFGGCLEYAKPEFCTYIEPKQYRRIPIMDGIPQFNNKIWPVLSLNDIKSALRHAYDHRQECSLKSKLAYNNVHSNFTYEAIGSQLLKILEVV